MLYTRFSEKRSPRGPKKKIRLGAPGQTCPPQDHSAPSARRFDETVPPPWAFHRGHQRGFTRKSGHFHQTWGFRISGFTQKKDVLHDVTRLTK